jgi:hypothetical protein
MGLWVRLLALTVKLLTENEVVGDLRLRLIEEKLTSLLTSTVA